MGTEIDSRIPELLQNFKYWINPISKNLIIDDIKELGINKPSDKKINRLTDIHFWIMFYQFLANSNLKKEEVNNIERK